MLESASPVFPVRDVEASVAWYERELGFTAAYVNRDPHGPSGQGEATNYAVIGLGAVQLHLLLNAYEGEPERAPAEAMFSIADGIDALFTELVAKGLQVQRPIADQPWGRRDFTILDPDGNYVWFSQPLS